VLPTPAIAHTLDIPVLHRPIGTPRATTRTTRHDACAHSSGTRTRCCPSPADTATTSMTFGGGAASPPAPSAAAAPGAPQQQASPGGGQCHPQAGKHQAAPLTHEQAQQAQQQGQELVPFPLLAGAYHCHTFDYYANSSWCVCVAVSARQATAGETRCCGRLPGRARTSVSRPCPSSTHTQTHTHKHTHTHTQTHTHTHAHTHTHTRTHTHTHTHTAALHTMHTTTTATPPPPWTLQPGSMSSGRAPPPSQHTPPATPAYPQNSGRCA
jgi:hypothetical protein